ETSQLYANCLAAVQPDWIVDLSAHVNKVQYYEPFYQGKSGQVMAFKRTILYGLILREKERVGYGKIDPILSREIFIRAALVEGDYVKSYVKSNARNAHTKGDFFTHNQNLIENVLELEARSRRRDIMVDDNKLFDFY